MIEQAHQYLTNDTPLSRSGGKYSTTPILNQMVDFQKQVVYYSTI